MKRFGLWLLLAAAMGCGARAQDSASAPRVVLRLSANIAPETAQIRYFLTGDFGGYGSFVRTAKDEWNYEIPTAAEGKRAGDLKAVVYVPGCEFETVAWKVEQAGMQKTLPCRPVAMTRLRGQISPAELTRKTTVKVSYLATWANRYFGIMDGMVMSVPMGTAEPDASGWFEMSVPAFALKDGDGQLWFFLNNGKNSEEAATLRVTSDGGFGNYFPAKAEYPEIVRMVAEPAR